LIKGLQSEKELWKKRKMDIQQQTVNSLGDSLMASLTISYLGMFTFYYRDKALGNLKKLLE
jgi:hypothetical protein